MQLPYLTAPLLDTFDHWIEGTLARFLPPLTFTELRKGVQALSMLYVERRDAGKLAERAVEGTGKRAALATYYAALHFLTTHHALEMVGDTVVAGTRKVVDLGCGTGAAGAALGVRLAPGAEVIGIDRMGWPLEEAERTYLAFGLRGKTRRSALPAGIPRTGSGSALVLGWMIGELDEESRVGLLRAVSAAAKRGTKILVLEPLAKAINPWWEEWVAALAPLGIGNDLIRVSIDRPPFIRDMDKAARLDHQVIGARVLHS